jgi:hypothetical protein
VPQSTIDDQNYGYPGFASVCICSVSQHWRCSLRTLVSPLASDSQHFVAADESERRGLGRQFIDFGGAAEAAVRRTTVCLRFVRTSDTTLQCG